MRPNRLQSYEIPPTYANIYRIPCYKVFEGERGEFLLGCSYVGRRCTIDIVVLLVVILATITVKCRQNVANMENNAYFCKSALMINFLDVINIHFTNISSNEKDYPFISDGIIGDGRDGNRSARFR
jgi:hypothetical protein